MSVGNSSLGGSSVRTSSLVRRRKKGRTRWRRRSINFGSGCFVERRFVTVLEFGRGAEIAGDEEIVERPEIEHGVFQRRAGEDEPVLRAKGLCTLRILAAAILDVLRLVEDDEGELFGAVVVDVAAKDGVAGDEEIVIDGVAPIYPRDWRR